MRGLTRSVAFEHEGDHLVSRGYHLCGFVPMQGAGAHTEHLISLDRDEVTLRVDETLSVDAERLRDALRAPRVQQWSGVELGGVEPIDDLDLWLATVVDDFGLLTATMDAIDSGLVAKSARVGAKTIVAGGTFVYRASARPVDLGRTRFELGVYAHGPEAEVLAKEYVELIRTWDREHRGGPGARIEVYPARTPDAELPPGRVIDKNHTRVVISWPGRGHPDRKRELPPTAPSPKEEPVTTQSDQTAVVPGTPAADSEFDLDVSIVESGPVIAELMRLTDDNCGSTCESPCVGTGC